MMIHNAWTIAQGNAEDMEQATAMLREVDKGVRAVYAAKTGKSDRDLARMMEAETWMSAPTALAEGFIDAIAYAQPETGSSAEPAASSTALSASYTVSSAEAGAHTHSICHHTHSLAHSHSLPDARPAAQAAPAAYSARRMRENVTAAVVACAGKQPDFLGKRLNVPEAARNTKTKEADAVLRARLRLLSM